MNTKNLILKCKDSAILSKDRLIKYRGYALVAVGIVIVAIIPIGAYWFMSSKNARESTTSSSFSSNQSQTIANGAASGTVSEYDYSEAPSHIGERATIHGTVVKTFTAKSGVTFFDFCQGFDACAFSAVVFASDLKAFGDLAKYERAVKLTGVIKSYQSKAEMVLNSPDQIE